MDRNLNFLYKVIAKLTWTYDFHLSATIPNGTCQRLEYDQDARYKMHYQTHKPHFNVLVHKLLVNTSGVRKVKRLRLSIL